MNCPLCNREVYSDSAEAELKPLWRAEHAWAHVVDAQHMFGMNKIEHEKLEFEVSELQKWVGPVLLGEWAD